MKNNDSKFNQNLSLWLRRRGTTLKYLCLEAFPAIRVPGEILRHFHPFQAKIY